MLARHFLPTLVLGVLAPALPARAGDYHDSATLHCSECHVMHATGVPGIAPSPGEPELPSGLSTATEAFVGRQLLREDINDLCLSCHDNSAKAADVLGSNQGGRPSDVRAAGHLNRLGSDGLPGSGHTLDAFDVAPGSNPAWKPEDENGTGLGLNCINCHAHHGGRGSYRNLRANAGRNTGDQGRITYNQGSPGSNDLSRDVFVRRSLDYDESAVDFNEPDPNGSAIGRFCAGCHTEFHGAPGSPRIGGSVQGESFTRFLRHPSSGVDIGALGGDWSSLDQLASRENRIKLASEVGVWDPPGSDVSPTCLSCHKAHGNGNAFGLIYRSGTGTLTEEGDTGGGSLVDLCSQCHGQASAFAGI